MREIKFRGIDFSQLKLKNKKEWIYGDFYRKRSSTNLKQDADFFIRVNGLYDLQIIPETLSQYTGLKDKNEKEIFEGDIVKLIGNFGKLYEDEGYPIISEVIFDNDEICFDAPKIRCTLNKHICSDCEVIGNIYETKGLIQ